MSKCLCTSTSYTDLPSSAQKNDGIACGAETGFGVQYIPHMVIIGKDGKIIKNKAEDKDYMS